MSEASAETPTELRSPEASRAREPSLAAWPPTTGRTIRSTPTPSIHRGWFVVAASTGAAAGSVTFFNPVLGVFARPLEEAFGWNRAEVAIALLAGGLAAAVAGPVFGWVMDKWGGRVLIPPAAMGMTIIALLLSQMSQLWHLLVLYAIARALSMGAVNQSAFTTVSNWFIVRRPLAISIVSLGPRLAMATFPLLVAVVIDMSGTWRAGWVALAVIIATLGILPPFFFMHRRPEDLGLLPDAGRVEDTPEGAPVEDALANDFTLREAVRTRAYWLVGIAIGLMMFCGGSINFHQIPHLEDQGLSGTQAALIVTVFSMVGAVGVIGGSALAARFGSRWVLVGSFVGVCSGVALLIRVDDMQSALIYAVWYGLSFGAMVTMNQVIYADYFGRRSLGMIRGSFQPVQMTLNALGPMLTGLMFVNTGSYEVIFSVFIGIFILCAIFLALSPLPTRPQRVEATSTT